MILTFDIGNTRTNIGLFDKNGLLKKFWIYTKDLAVNLESCLSDNLAGIEIDSAVIGSVVNDVSNGVCCVLRKLFEIEPVIISSDSELPIKLSVDFPDKLGVDRIANGAFGFSKFNQAVIVIDCGSAITFDIVSDSGEFLGGIISLGLNNQLKSLISSAPALPEISIEPVDTAIGSNTKNAILSGVIKGTAAMIDGMVKNSVQELGSGPKIVLTGGDAEFISEYLDTKIDVIDLDFTLKALKYLLEYQNA